MFLNNLWGYPILNNELNGLAPEPILRLNPLEGRGGGSTPHPLPNLARACQTTKKFFESSLTLPTVACEVSSLHLKPKSF